MPYKRNIFRQLAFYRFTLIILLACFIILAYLGKYSYAVFFIAGYLIRDFIFSITEVDITNESLIITKYYLGGFIKLKTMIDRAKIIALKNIDAGMSTDNQIDFEIGVFQPTGNDIPKKYELYRIDYQNKNNQIRKAKIQLSKEEEILLN